MKRTRRASVGALVCAVFLVSACASGTSTTETGSSGAAQSTKPVSVSFDPKAKTLIPDVPVEQWCGPKKANVAVFDGIPLDAWRRIALAVYKKEAAKCASIDQNIIEVSAGGDPKKANSDVDALSAQGYKLITGWADYGEAMLPAFRAATKAGAVVVPYGNEVGGTPGVDYAANTYLDNAAGAKSIAESVAKHLNGKGNVVSVGGAAGAKSAQTFHQGVKEGLAEFPGITLLNKDYIVTDWSPVEAQKKTTAFISQHRDIDAVIIDYGATGAAVVRAFDESGVPVPTVGVLGAANEIACQWKDHDKKGKGFDLISADSVHATIKAAAQQGIAAVTGGKYNLVQSYVTPLTNDTSAGKDPTCDPKLPVDTDFTTPLTVDELVKVLKSAQQ